ncbi:helix-turn-helix domain-containing protein [Neorhizobium sp. BT27B]|uniref:helix-turn-helix domain-containing protein n=1 Tax=Neorhizobium sp. BT27B TaxID=3142625 RepID=UPI003D2A65C0
MGLQNAWIGNRILIVEDDYLIASQMATNLAKEGIVVVGPSASVESALAQIAETPTIAGAVLDVKLGEELVFSVADELERRDIPFVFATGLEPDIIPKRHASKVVLRKPVEERSILKVLSGPCQKKPVSHADACRNGVLSRLSHAGRNALLPKLRMQTLPQGAIMEAPQHTVRHVYFPLDCVGSVIVMAKGGSRIETGLIGREAMTGSGLLCGDDQTLYELVTQIEGDVLSMSSEDFVSVLGVVPELGQLAARCSRTLGLQVSHTALANGRYELHQRLARWLAMVYDRVPGKTLHLTHDYLSVMLGVRRPSVTTTLHVLEGQHLIRSTRGSIEVRDYRGLVAAAGEAYGLPEAEYDRIMALPLTNMTPFPPLNDQSGR